MTRNPLMVLMSHVGVLKFLKHSTIILAVKMKPLFALTQLVHAPLNKKRANIEIKSVVFVSAEKQ